MKDAEPSPQPSFRVDPRLARQVIEREAEVAAAAGDNVRGSVLSRLLEPVYERSADPHSRRVGFEEIYLKLFAEWGHAAFLQSVAVDFPEVLRAVRSIWIGSAERGEAAEADLGGADMRELGICLLQQLFPDRAALELFLRRELTRISDILDPFFGHQPGTLLTGRPGALENLARDRLRLLWGISVDGRLARRWPEYGRLKDERLLEVRSRYRSLPPSFSEGLLGWLWSHPRPVFETLRDWACNNDCLASHFFPERPDPPGAFIPGSPCPLCGFPVFRLVEPKAWRSDQLLREILSDFPAWQPDEGACERCVEGYQVRVGLWA